MESQSRTFPHHPPQTLEAFSCPEVSIRRISQYESSRISLEPENDLYDRFASGSAEGGGPLPEFGVSLKYFFFFLRRLRRHKKRKKWGCAPYPSQEAKSLATPYKRCLTGFSKIRDVSYIKTICELPQAARSDKKRNDQSSTRPAPV